MKITKETDILMILKDRGVIAYIIAGILITLGIFILIGAELLPAKPPIWSGFLTLFIGILIIIFKERVTYTLDTQKNTVSITTKKLYKKEYAEYTLSDIRYVLFSKTLRISNNRRAYVYHLDFVLQGDEVVPLAQSGTSFSIPFVTIVPLKKLGRRVADFLEVPLKEKQPSQIESTLSTAQTVLRNISNNT